MQIDTAVAIPMRDGVMLKAHVWRPAAGGRVPVLIVRTPYGRGEDSTGPDFIREAIARGYAVIVQDVRGRYGSGRGVRALPARGEGRLRHHRMGGAQPWSNGAVGTFGLSYPGAVQWLAAVEPPPSLKAMVPAMTYATPESFWYSGGVWDGSWLDWVWFNIAPDLRDAARPPRSEDRQGGVRGMGARRTPRAAAPPDAHAARLPGRRALVLRVDAASAARSLVAVGRAGRPVRRREAAVLNLSGWFDEPYGPMGAVTNYNRLVETRPKRLTRGPA